MTSDLERLRPLLEEAEIESITTVGFSADRRTEDEPVPDGFEEGMSTNLINLMASTTPGRLGYRFEATSETHEALARAEVAIWYRTGRDTEEPEDVVLDFANHIAFFAVYPYLREILHSSTARLGQPIVLPILRQSSAGFGPNAQGVSEGST